MSGDSRMSRVTNSRANTIELALEVRLFEPGIEWEI